MAQITSTAIIDPQTGQRQKAKDGTLVLFAAKDYAPNFFKEKICACPDENCPALLTRYKQYVGTFYDELTGEPFSATVPAHFKRQTNGPQHSDDCSALARYASYYVPPEKIDRSHMSRGEIVLNNNIPTDHAFKKSGTGRRLLGHSFQEAADIPSEQPRRQTLSRGFASVLELANHLRAAYWDDEKRKKILIRRGAQSIPLNDYYQEKPDEFFKALFKNKQTVFGVRPALVLFKPIKSPEFHKQKALTLEGEDLTRTGKDGFKYNIAFKVHCADKKTYDAMVKSVRHREVRTLLVDSAKCWVDVDDSKQKIKNVQEGKPKGQTLFVHVYIGHEAQFCVWEPSTKLALDLPLQPRPEKPTLPPLSQPRAGL